ncbi:CD209 antigen-like [Eleginops maclovinus]|uniref:CD209 antigen-like n=1 Tax=Eleginops maclovinus TaxID=56733 RepID=UPI0030805359
MDEMSVYINVEESSVYYSRSNMETKISEHIYENVPILTQRHHGPGTAPSDAKEVKRTSCRAAHFCLCLLCLFLLTGLVTLVYLVINSNSEWKMEMVLLQNSYKNLTIQNDQLQTSYNILTEEREQLKISNNNLTSERNQLHINLTIQLRTSNNILTEKREQLKIIDALTIERNDLQRKLQGNSKFEGDEGQKDTLQILITSSSTDQTAPSVQLDTMDEMSVYINVEESSVYYSRSNMETKISEHIYENVPILTQRHHGPGTAPSDAKEVKRTSCRADAFCLCLLCLFLLTGLVTLVYLVINSNSEWKMEMVLLQNSYKNLTIQNDQLQTSYNILTEEREQLKISNNNLTSERNQLHINLTIQLRTSNNILTEKREQLKIIDALTIERNDLQRKLQGNSKCKKTDEMVSLEEELEPSMVYENFHYVSARNAASRPSGEEFKMPAAAPGMKMFRMVVVSFGLLCILQAALNISLRLTLFSQQNSLTEERDELKRINFDLEASSRNLTEERDELKRTLKNYVSEQNSLTEERDDLKRIILDMVTTNKNLAEERHNLTTTQTDCGWLYFNDSAYHFSSIEKNWQESRDDCLQKGADLVIINSQEEQNFLSQFKKTMWIGLTDLETEGTWKWVDGTPMTERYWGPNEPNGKTSENCGDTKQYDVGNHWNDENCNVKVFWTCEKIVHP